MQRWQHSNGARRRLRTVRRSGKLKGYCPCSPRFLPMRAAASALDPAARSGAVLPPAFGAIRPRRYCQERRKMGNSDHVLMRQSAAGKEDVAILFLESEQESPV